MTNRIFSFKEKFLSFFSTHRGAWLGVIFVMGMIFYYSSQSQPVHGVDLTFETVIRKIAHLFEFGLLLLAIFNLYRRYRVKISRSLLFSLSLTFLYSITDELHQSFIFGRTATYRDVVIDMAGALVAAWIIALFMEENKRLEKN